MFTESSENLLHERKENTKYTIELINSKKELSWVL